MSDNQTAAIIVPLVVGMPLLLAFAKMWFRHRERMPKANSSPVLGDGADARLARLEQAMDAIAVEMERLGEGQRFMTRLLAERGGSAQPVAELASPRGGERGA